MIAPMEAGAQPVGDPLRDDIEQARAELGRTLQELMVRVDVRSRARASVSHAADRMRASMRSPTPWVALAAGLATVVVLANGSRLRLRRRLPPPLWQGRRRMRAFRRWPDGAEQAGPLLRRGRGAGVRRRFWGSRGHGLRGPAGPLIRGRGGGPWGPAPWTRGWR